MHLFRRSLLQSTESTASTTISGLTVTTTNSSFGSFPLWLIPLIPIGFILIYGVVVVIIAHKRQQLNMRIIPTLTRSGHTRQSIQGQSSSPLTETEIELQDALNKIHRLKGQEQNLNKQISSITRQIVKTRTQAEKSKNDLAHEKRLREKAESLIEGARQQAKKEIYAKLSVEANRRDIAHKLSNLKQQNEQLNKQLNASKAEVQEKLKEIERIRVEYAAEQKSRHETEDLLEESRTEAYDHYLNAENEKIMRQGIEAEIQEVLQGLEKPPVVEVELELDLNSPITEEMTNVLTSHDWQVQLIKAETVRTACHIFFLKYRPYQKVTKDQISKRFLKLSHLLHPDKNINVEEKLKKIREERFAYLTRAKALLLSWVEEEKKSSPPKNPIQL